MVSEPEDGQDDGQKSPVVAAKLLIEACTQRS
jgi:hypothetical protein